MNIKTQKWVEAGKILQGNSLAKVQCPECEIGILQVKDEPIESEENRIDRYIFCNNCGKWNVITMLSPESGNGGNLSK